MRTDYIRVGKLIQLFAVVIFIISVFALFIVRDTSVAWIFITVSVVGFLVGKVVRWITSGS
jgi:hypothetical protein